MQRSTTDFVGFNIKNLNYSTIQFNAKPTWSNVKFPTLGHCTPSSLHSTVAILESYLFSPSMSVLSMFLDVFEMFLKVWTSWCECFILVDEFLRLNYFYGLNCVNKVGAPYLDCTIQIEIMVVFRHLNHNNALMSPWICLLCNTCVI